MQNHSILANDLILATIRKADEASRERDRGVVSDYKDNMHGRSSSQHISRLDQTNANYDSHAYRDSSFVNDSRDDIFTDEYERRENSKRLVDQFTEELGSKPDKLFDVRKRQSFRSSRVE